MNFVKIYLNFSGPHLITGNGVGFKPDILDMDLMEGVLMVKSEDAVKMARELALKEGLMVITLLSLDMGHAYFALLWRSNEHLRLSTVSC